LSQQTNLLFFTQSHFPESMIDLWWRRKTLDSHLRACLDLTQGTGQRIGAPQFGFAS